MYIKVSYRKTFSILLLLFASTIMRAEDFQAEDTLAKEIHAALIVADPGEIFYSCVGHCALHMRAPEYDLDYIFSYEAENARSKLLSFLAGNLKMGMFAYKTYEDLQYYKENNRGVIEYPLNLPLEVKRNLWRILDERLMDEQNIPYEYIKHGCAYSTLMILKEALDTIPIEYGPWPEKFSKLSRRELTALQMQKVPWTKAFMNMITNGSIDYDCSYEEKVVMPADLIEILKNAKIQGQPIMSSEAKVIEPSTNVPERPWFTPLLLSIILLVLSVLSFLPVINGGIIGKIITGVLLAIQFFVGTITTYLVLFSNLCCTEWSWLIIPYNPLPLIFWKWRRYWTLPYAAINVLWALGVVFAPHRCTETSYIVLSIAIAIVYIREYHCKKDIIPNETV